MFLSRSRITDLKKPEIRYFNANYFKTMGNCQLQTRKQFPDLPQGSVAPNRHDECVSSCGHSSKAKGSGWDQMGARPASRRPHPHTTSPNPLPPMAGKGTEGRGETAEKTRHTRVQPLNTDVTVKALCALSSSDIYAWLPPQSVQPCIHREGMHTFILWPRLTSVWELGYHKLIWPSTHRAT